jgi:hypothetical protein
MDKDKKLKDVDDLLTVILNMCKTCSSNPNYSRVDLAETIIRRIREVKN